MCSCLCCSGLQGLYNITPGDQGSCVHVCVVLVFIKSGQETRFHGFMCSYLCSSGLQGLYKAGDENAMKTDVVEYARKNWPMFFSRFFEVVKVSGRTMSFSMSTLIVHRLVNLFGHQRKLGDKIHTVNTCQSVTLQRQNGRLA